MAQVDKDGRRKYNVTLLVGHLPTISAGRTGYTDICYQKQYNWQNILKTNKTNLTKHKPFRPGESDVKPKQLVVYM